MGGLPQEDSFSVGSHKRIPSLWSGTKGFLLCGLPQEDSFSVEWNKRIPSLWAPTRGFLLCGVEQKDSFWQARKISALRKFGKKNRILVKIGVLLGRCFENE